MDCLTIQNKLSQYIDNNCTEEEIIVIEEHLKTCSDCNEEYRLLKSIVEDINDIEGKELPENYHNSLMKKIKKERRTYSKKSFFKNAKMIYPSVAAIFILILVFGVIGRDTINDYTKQGDGILFEERSVEDENITQDRLKNFSEDKILSDEALKEDSISEGDVTDKSLPSADNIDEDYGTTTITALEESDTIEEKENNEIAMKSTANVEDNQEKESTNIFIYVVPISVIVILIILYYRKKK